jgi:hemerythrin-like domain-containing protein
MPETINGREITRNAAAFQAVLDTVEQDHQLVLNKMQALKDAVCELLDLDTGDPGPVLDRLWDSNEYFATQFASHLAEEEAALFPLLERLHSEGPALVNRLRREHGEIRRKREELGNCLELAVELKEGLTPTVIRDVLTYGWELWALLDDHARLETQAVHQCLMQSLAGAPQ